MREILWLVCINKYLEKWLSEGTCVHNFHFPWNFPLSLFFLLLLLLILGFHLNNVNLQTTLEPFNSTCIPIYIHTYIYIFTVTHIHLFYQVLSTLYTLQFGGLFYSNLPNNPACVYTYSCKHTNTYYIRYFYPYSHANLHT